jgi:LuxR family transcriptional regulator, quorum-sensing system regulator BjaR1
VNVYANGNIAWQNNMNLAEFISSCSTEFDVFRACATIGERHGLPFFSIIRMPEAGETQLSELTLASNWPASLIRQYDRHKLLEQSPAIAELRRSTAPVLWDGVSLEKQLGNPHGPVARKLFEAHELSRGVYFGVHSVAGLHGAISFSGHRDILTEAELMNLNYHSMLIFDRLCALSDIEAGDGPALSKRERECIVWTSQGKTSFEIGVILGLSEHTINNYLANVCRKLGATNRAHLVGIALRQKLIR